MREVINNFDMEEKDNREVMSGNDSAQNHSGNNHDGRNEIFSRSVRAGKRTYFFDVKSTRAGERYLTITESKRRFNNENGKFTYEKHKVFLYKEDFDKFMDGLNQALNFIQSSQPIENTTVAEENPTSEIPSPGSIEFEDLDDISTGSEEENAGI
ncbi:MAG: PUR family DNA/RNA-binding protein [Bacteroidales bacterium]